MRLRRPYALFLACMSLALTPSLSNADTISFVLSENSSSPGGNLVQVLATIDDGIVAGKVQVSLSVIDNPLVAGVGVGDLQGFFFSVANESFLKDLNVIGAEVTGFSVSADSIKSGPLGPFDAKATIGTPGIGKDDIPSTEFLIEHSLLSLTAFGPVNALFPNFASDPGFIAVNVTSIGLEGGPREFSGHFGGAGEITPGIPGPGNPGPGGPSQSPGEIPEPSSMLAFASLALAAAVWARRRQTAASAKAAQF